MDATEVLPDHGDGIRDTHEDVDMEQLGSSSNYRHVLELISREDSEQMCSLINQAVTEQLRNWGIDYEWPTYRGRSKVRKSNSIKPIRHDSGCNKLVLAKLAHWDITVAVPVIIKETCDFLRKYISTEGIFRKSGSLSRVAALMQRFGNLELNENFCFITSDSVFDVATVLKQYLREMDSPLIPYELHSLFRKCLEVPSECSREEAVVLSTCLLPMANLNVLTYLIEFFIEVVQNSKENRMSFENLAIVIGPNVMPVISKKSEKAKDLENERRFIEAHTKILEVLIRNGQRLGCLPSEIEKKVEGNFSLRGSEDELENDGVSRRKKRRSGSLTRVLGFLKKVTSNKSGDTPASQTPGDFSDFTHTPVIKTGKRRCLDENIFSLQKKKTILDGIRKNGLIVKDDDKRFAHITNTPNSITGFITCPSPVCLNPSPMRMDWKQTPNAARFKNLVTPSLLRRKDKTVELNKNITPFSAPAKPMKSRLGLGKKSSKKQTPLPLLGDKLDATRSDVKRMASTVSIHKLANSPRKVSRASSTRIPRPDKINTVRKSNSSCRFPIVSPRGLKLDVPLPERVHMNISGEYVTLSPRAQISDEKNEAFIASKISCLEDTLEQQDSNITGNIRLTPLIQEINTLTLTAQRELTLSGLRKNVSSKYITEKKFEDFILPNDKAPPIPSKSVRRRSSGTSNKARLNSPSENSNCDLAIRRRNSVEDARTRSIRQVEDKFIRAMKETKIMRIQSENSAMRTKANKVNLHRRFSVQDKGVSPSQRRIISAARRRSHELSRPTHTTPISTPAAIDSTARFNDIKPWDSLTRSANRCTLKRGRPNTLRSGLAKPSPSSRNNSITTVTVRPMDSSKENPFPDQEMITDQYVSTPMRRMSSVQELVKFMEKAKNDKPEVDNLLKPVNRSESKKTLSRQQSSSSMFVKPAAIKAPKNSKAAIETTFLTPKMRKDLKRNCRTLEENTSDWVAASDFNFETHTTRFLLNHNEDRDSIQALKTLNAGKVSENVKLFDGMSRTRKSPGKSLIPRYVALHRQESFKNIMT